MQHPAGRDHDNLSALELRSGNQKRKGQYKEQSLENIGQKCKKHAFSVKDFRAGARGLEEYRKQRESWLRHDLAIGQLLNQM